MIVSERPRVAKSFSTLQIFGEVLPLPHCMAVHRSTFFSQLDPVKPAGHSHT